MKKLIVSFSGGRTSAYMLRRLLDEQPIGFDIRVVFANTGLENEKTLEFVRNVADRWWIPITWVEAKVNPISGVGTNHEIVTYETASRKGEPFEAVIAKYGITNKAFPHCTRELKARPIRSLMREWSWLDAVMAIGIRADEAHRVKEHWYPLVHEFPTTKEDVNYFWRMQPFDLGLREHEGNCTTCWKKSERKLVQIMREQPSAFDFFARMEHLHAHSGPGKSGEPKRFFRGHKTVKDIREMAALLPPEPARHYPMFSDENDGCSESCEAF